MTVARLAGLLVCVLGMMAAYPVVSFAKEPTRLRDCTAGGPLYSPLHFWTPAIYRWRAWCSTRPFWAHPWGSAIPTPGEGSSVSPATVKH